MNIDVLLKRNWAHCGAVWLKEKHSWHLTCCSKDRWGGHCPPAAGCLGCCQWLCFQFVGAEEWEPWKSDLSWLLYLLLLERQPLRERPLLRPKLKLVCCWARWAEDNRDGVGSRGGFAAKERREDLCRNSWVRRWLWRSAYDSSFALVTRLVTKSLNSPWRPQNI